MTPASVSASCTHPRFRVPLTAGITGRSARRYSTLPHLMRSRAVVCSIGVCTGWRVAHLCSVRGLGSWIGVSGRAVVRCQRGTGCGGCGGYSGGFPLVRGGFLNCSRGIDWQPCLEQANVGSHRISSGAAGGPAPIGRRPCQRVYQIPGVSAVISSPMHLRQIIMNTCSHTTK